MFDENSGIANPMRRSVLRRGVGTAAAMALPASAAAKSVHPHKLRFHLEGVVDLAWVHSLYLPPALAAGLPPGMSARLRAEYPASDASRARGRRIAFIEVFLAPSTLRADEPAPPGPPISVLEVAIEETMLLVAAFGDPATRPRHNLASVGHIVGNEIESPFGSLVHRVATLSFGFEWTDASNDDAAFTLIAAGAAGSHITVVPRAFGEIVFV